MLEKHNNSKINNSLGIILCTILMVFALTKAPQSIASDDTQDTEVSFKFDEIPLKSILGLIFEANPKDVIGYENVPEVSLSFEAWNVSANKVEELILKCSGLKLSRIDEKYKIVKGESFSGDYSQLNECIEIKSIGEGVSEETIDTIKKRNKQLREHMKKMGKNVPEVGTLPFENN